MSLISLTFENAKIDLRQRLLSLLEDALHQLNAAETIEPGLLRLIADASGVLRVLDQLERDTGAMR